MNTYNDNLRASVIESLDTQGTQRKKMKSQYNASMFKLYYAQGAKIKAAEKLELANDALVKKANVKEQAVKNNNIATNVVMASSQEKSYVEKSKSNAAVCAANIQVATNAIVRLASDIASINSIANVADYDTEISNPYHDVFKLMGTTAYNAELASQWAMEASEYTAKISADTVNSVATLTDSSVKDLLKVTSSQFDEVSQSVAADNEALANSSIKEKTAEGQLEDTNVDYNATVTSYDITNDELNLDLTVNNLTPTSYDVSFNLLKSSFKAPDEKDVANTFYDLEKLPIEYPADAYYAMLVKEEKRATFSLALAEHILQTGKPYKLDGKNKFFPINIGDGDSVTQTITNKQLYDTDNEEVVLGQNYVIFIVAELKKDYKKMVNNFDDFVSAASFPFALTKPLSAPNTDDFCYSETYDVKSEATIIAVKNKIFNKEQELVTYEEEKDRLEALITLNTNELKKLKLELLFGIGNKTVLNKRINALNEKIKDEKDKRKKASDNITKAQEEIDTFKKELSADEPKTYCSYSCSGQICDEKPEINNHDFNLKEAIFSFKINPDNFNTLGKAQYRCMFLPYTESLIKDLLNTQGLANVEAEATLIKKLNADAKLKITAQQNLIDDYNKNILELGMLIGDLSESLLALELALEGATSKEESKKISKDIDATIEAMESAKDIIGIYNDFILVANNTIVDIKNQLKDDLSSISFNVDDKKQGLFFNLELAEQVTAGNYYVAKSLMKTLIPVVTPESNSGNVVPNKLNYQVIIDPDTTDNFGNPLIVGNQYIPVVLVISNAPESEMSKYTSAISDFESISSFTYGEYAKKD